MKNVKMLVVGLAAISLTACAGYHQSKNGILFEQTSVEIRPLQVDVKVGEKITGTAECKVLFGIVISGPARQVYGVPLQTVKGNFVPSACTKGAVYDAMNKSNADIIIAPQYTSVRSCKFWFGTCIYETAKIIVNGYKGSYGTIKEMSEDVIKARQISGVKASEVINLK